jgi:Fe-S cluster assembly iron-binding protein IscA
VLTLTQDATEAIEDILQAPGMPDGAGLRIAPSRSADGNEPRVVALELSVAAQPAETDSVIREHGARVFLDEAVAGQLDDKQLDATVGASGVHFAIDDQRGDG